MTKCKVGPGTDSGSEKQRWKNWQNLNKVGSLGHSIVPMLLP